MSDLASIQQFVTLEGILLDEQRYDEWLSLYAEDAEYWVPSWDDEQTLIEDPYSQVSLIFYNTRSGLEDRIFRVQTEKSSASFPPPRTTHLVSNIQITGKDGDNIHMRTNWATYSFKDKKTSVYHGSSHYLLRPHEGEHNWQIAKKKIIIQNDYLSHVVDFYSIY